MKKRPKLDADATLKRVSAETTLVQNPRKVVDLLIECGKKKEGYLTALRNIYVNVDRIVTDKYARHCIMSEIKSVIPDADKWLEIYN